MLEDKEFEKNLGEYGSVSVDVTPQLEVEIALTAKIDLVAEIEKLAAKTKTQLDDKFIATLKSLLPSKDG